MKVSERKRVVIGMVPSILKSSLFSRRIACGRVGIMYVMYCEGRGRAWELC
jgi:hypothetical protein